VRAVRDWLAAFKAADADKLAITSTTPFVFSTDYQRKKCDATAKDSAKLQKLFRCLFVDERTFIGELAAVEPVLAPPSSDSTSLVEKKPSALKKLIGKLGMADGQTLVDGFLNGDGITFTFVFAVRPIDGRLLVSGLLLQFERVE